MARGRMLSQGIARDVKFNSMGCEAKLLFLMAIPHLDRDGLIHGHPTVFLGSVAPLIMLDILPRLEDIIAEWVRVRLVIVYEDNNGPALYFRGFTKNQAGMRYDRESPSTFDPPPGYMRTSAGLVEIPPDDKNYPPPRPSDDPIPPTPTDSGRSPAEVRQKSGEGPLARGRARAEVEVKVEGEVEVSGVAGDIADRNEGRSNQPPPTTHRKPADLNDPRIVLDDIPPKRQAASREQSAPDQRQPFRRSDFYDPRKIRKDGTIREGTGATPVEVTLEYIPFNQNIFTPFVMGRIAEQVTDLDKWRNVLQETCLRGFKIHNISDRLTIYEHGWRNGNGAKEVQSNGQVEISLSGML